MYKPGESRTSKFFHDKLFNYSLQVRTSMPCIYLPFERYIHVKYIKLIFLAYYKLKISFIVLISVIIIASILYFLQRKRKWLRYNFPVNFFSLRRLKLSRISMNIKKTYIAEK
ncbi:hypothetical protein HZS_913 [Henneguya salminicola]|nr:hypothetical protein HZS_913 [Henneguya salminicola]